jgi:hypothetical protein
VVKRANNVDYLQLMELPRNFQRVVLEKYIPIVKRWKVQPGIIHRLPWKAFPDV